MRDPSPQPRSAQVARGVAMCGAQRPECVISQLAGTYVQVTYGKSPTGAELKRAHDSVVTKFADCDQRAPRESETGLLCGVAMRLS
jgi:hypothetical protein